MPRPLHTCQNDGLKYAYLCLVLLHAPCPLNTSIVRGSVQYRHNIFFQTKYILICSQVKVYTSLYHLHDFFDTSIFQKAVLQGDFQDFCRYFWIVSVVPLVLGFIYAIFKVVFKEKKVCSLLHKCSLFLLA